MAGLEIVVAAVLICTLGQREKPDVRSCCVNAHGAPVGNLVGRWGDLEAVRGLPPPLGVAGAIVIALMVFFVSNASTWLQVFRGGCRSVGSSRPEHRLHVTAPSFDSPKFLDANNIFCSNEEC